jgi:putative endonuclease
MESTSILPNVGSAKPAVYILRCKDGTLYTGATTNLPRRLSAHDRRAGAKYTRSRLPVVLIAWWHPPTFSLAKSHEARFKRLTRSAKLAALKLENAFGFPIHRPFASGLGTSALVVPKTDAPKPVRDGKPGKADRRRKESDRRTQV